MIAKTIDSKLYSSRYKNVFAGDAKWKKVKSTTGLTYEWNKKSTYVKHPPYFEDMNFSQGNIGNILEARVLGIFGDSVTTDHISPAGSIKTDGPAGDYLKSKSVKIHDFNSFGARRGNHEVMMRGTFSNIRIKNEMLDGIEGGYTKHYPSKKQMSIYDAAIKYKKENKPLIIFSGKDYGMGSSRDWAAKGTNLLGVKAVVAESYERIHRSNLVGMGVLPLQFYKGQNRKSLKLTGSEIISIAGLDNEITPNMILPMTIKYSSGKIFETKVNCLIKTVNEVEYLQTGGILQYVLKNLAETA